MNNELTILTASLNEICGNCESPNECQNNCLYQQMRDAVEALMDGANGEAAQGCWICEDKKGKKKEVFYFDSANNMREAKYCPECGRKLL